MQQPKEEQPQTTREPSVPTYGLLYITQAYNRKEITFNEWLRLSREWAERILRQEKKE